MVVQHSQNVLLTSITGMKFIIFVVRVLCVPEWFNFDLLFIQNSSPLLIGSDTLTNSS